MKKALVQYASSDEGEETATSAAPALPSLPKELDAVYVVDPRKGQDPAFHGGRQRQVAHTQGLWPSHIQLDVTLSQDQRQSLAAFLDAAHIVLEEDYETLLVTPLGVDADLHISLTPGIMLPGEHKDTFPEAIVSAVSQHKNGSLQFEVIRPAVFGNIDGQRTFPVLQLRPINQDGFDTLMQGLDSVLGAYGTAPLYTSREGLASLHVSIAWRRPESSIQQNHTRRLEQLKQHPAFRRLQGQLFSCSHLRVKVGNELHLIALS
ncbi:U6 snRNA phosphodiesterase Usb1 [Protomyces lactucae-debilis]|uniref:U6 snRNA phosphodiesterase 1 n=1 Tax=Protomyces lactucae-debilis TaxID=2754530 RepID=A0A1Y2EZZ0_PROLT|nr:U6 snRNA phosphodiesterase Usb1 [Protomyces lactucae-debilis]ORY76686.1 U6 snRNA phosphodiesterase Usb1 [Protomyces lactucae-debilis]